MRRQLTTMLATISPVLFAIVALLQPVHGRVVHGDLDPKLDLNLNPDLNLDQTKDEEPNVQYIDQTIQAAGQIEAGRNDHKDGMVKAELDMWLTKEQYELLHGDQVQMSRQKRSAVRDERYRWTDKQVWYRRAPDDYTDQQWQLVVDGMKEFEDKTCMTFHEDVDKTRGNYIYVHDGDDCSSQLGMLPYPVGQNLSLRVSPRVTFMRDGCLYPEIIAHEIGHALGLAHEHNRPDRDEYIKINEENIKEKYKSEYKKDPIDETNYYNISYDFYSVMHYGPKLYTNNRFKNTFEPLEKYKKYKGKIGVAPNSLSFHDVMLVNRMYKCDEKCKKTSPCPPDSYMGQDCKCYCQGYNDFSKPIECGTKPLTTKQPTTKLCRDKNEKFCSTLSARMCIYEKISHDCPRTCNKCDCQDKVGADCSQVKELRICVNDWVNHDCAKTCGTC